MRVGWIVTCALAVIGGFLLVLRVCWLLHVEPSWLPYVAHVIGAVLAGLAIGRQGPLRSQAEPIVGGMLGVGILAVTAFAPPHAFGWIVARTAQPWLVGAIVAVASGLAAAGGAWLAHLGRTRGDLPSIILLSTLVTTCVMMLGGRLAVVTFGLSTTTMWVLTIGGIACGLAAFATQAIVAEEHLGACASGFAALCAIQLLELVTKAHESITLAIVFTLVVPYLPALVGARLAWRLKPRAAEPHGAFD